MAEIDYLIIGGGIAGTSAADSIRSKDQNGSILIITEEPERVYSRVLLPHYLQNENTLQSLYLRKEEDYTSKKIELLKNERVIKLDTQRKTVETNKNQTFTYKKLLIASGGKVNKLPIPGKELPQVVYLRTIEDAKKIKDLISKSKEAVVLGGGFIGAEFAQSFKKNNLKTTVVIREKYFWEMVVGENSGRLLSNILTENGVNLITETLASEFVGNEKLEGVKLSDGKVLKADVVGVGIGIHLDLDYLKETDLVTKTGVVTNEFLETSSQNVWAAGDIAEFYDPVLKSYHILGNWANAASQGRIAGLNMTGEKNIFETVSMYSINIFGNNFSFLGDPKKDETTEVVERGSVEERALARLLIKDDVVVGASLINLPLDRNYLTNLIKTKTKVTNFKNRLKDLNFNLSQITS
jgi:NAD(P)H-nitrite reductase large subunit